jgi:transcriptional regulator
MNEPQPPSPSEALPVVKGTLDLLALKAIGGRPMHGFEVTSWIEKGSGGRLLFDDSAIYQALYRLEKRGQVEADWGVTENNRRARYYTLTRRGRETLRADADTWERYTRSVGDILALEAP